MVFEQKVEPVEAAPKKHNGSQVLKRRQRKREINNCSEKHKQAFREQGSSPLAQHPRDFLHCRHEDERLPRGLAASTMAGSPK